MPELPEVETVRCGLQPIMERAIITKVELHRPDLRRPFPRDLAVRLRHRAVHGLRRRAKYLLVDVEGGLTLLSHLGMSGRLLVAGRVLGRLTHAQAAAHKHDHMVLHLNNGAEIRFNDPRRFGLVDLLHTAQAAEHPLLAHLGPEPLGPHFHAAYLSGRLQGRKCAIKSALMDQRIVAGLGNIYACEALFRARISPLARAGALSEAQHRRLVRAVRSTLQDAIAAGGSSLRDFRNAQGEQGYFQHAFDVYDRKGQACLRESCTGVIARLVQGARASFYCPACQRLPSS